MPTIEWCRKPADHVGGVATLFVGGTTMRTRFAVGLATAGLLVWAALPARAGDTVRLDLKGNDGTFRTLVDDGTKAEDIQVARGGGRGGGGFSRGGRGGGGFSRG